MNIWPLFGGGHFSKFDCILLSINTLQVFSKSEQQPTTSSSSVPLSSLFDNSVVEANNAQAPFMGYRSGEEISNNGLENNQVKRVN